jgi:hypothetical protein
MWFATNTYVKSFLSKLFNKPTERSTNLSVVLSLSPRLIHGNRKVEKFLAINNQQSHQQVPRFIKKITLRSFFRSSTGIIFRAFNEKNMAKKKESSASKRPVDQKKQEEKKLLEKHPFETMSQIQNRYGDGRARTGSDGTNQEANRLNH